jgi:hypothetical protein
MPLDLPRPIPEWVRGPLAPLADGTGTVLSPAEVSALVLLMLAAWGGSLALARSLPVRFTLGVVVGLHLVLALAPPLFSADVFGYLAYARLEVVHETSAYVEPPLAMPADPVLPLVGLADRVSPYGPLFTILSLPLAWLELPTAVWVLKAGHGLVALAALALVWSSARRLGRAPLPPVLFVALNPLWLVWAVGGAHNDLLAVLLLLAAIRLALARRDSIWTGAALGGAVTVKLSAGLALPFLLLGAPARRRTVAGAVAAIAVVAGLSVFILEPGAAGFAGTAFDHAGFVSLYSLPSALAGLIGLGGVSPGLRAGLGVALAAVLASAFRSVLRGGDWRAAAGWATLALVGTSTWLYPWYVVWVLPFAALGASARLRWATVVLTALVIAVRLPHGLTSVF